MKTPKFIQIMATGAGEGYSTELYALGEDGRVYKWTEKRESSDRPWTQGWKKLSDEVMP